jgi:outer membrane protein
MKLHLLMFICLCLILSFSSPQAEGNSVLTLDQAIQTTLENNPGIDASDAGIEIERAGVKREKSAYYPEITSRLIVPFIGRESGFFLDQLLYDFGRTSNRVKSSKARLRSSKYDRDATREDLILDTQIAYYTVLANTHLAQAREKKVVENEKRLEQSKGFLEAGRIPPIDVTKTEVDLGNSKLEALSALNELEIAKVNLLTVMGLEGEFTYELEDTSVYKKEIIELESAIDQALQTRPELKSLEAKEEAMKANLKVTKKEFYPLIYGRTSYRFKGEGATTPGFIAGVGLKFPIFLGFSRFADIESARGNLKRVKAEMAQQKAAIVSEIKKLYLDLEYSEENIKVIENTKRSALLSLELANERYRLRRASDVELAEAESLYATTNATYMQSIYNYNIAAARLKHAIGENGYPQK